MWPSTMLSRKRFKKRTVKCPYPNCDKFCVSSGGLTQHIQSCHVATKRHPAQPPSPRPADHEGTPFDDNMGGPEDEHVGSYTIFHPIIDGSSSECSLENVSP
jgi:hypothetical protein